MSNRSRATGKNPPEEGEISPAHNELLDSYRSDYDSDRDDTQTDPILSLRGLGKHIWTDEEADRYVKRLRERW